MFVTITKTIRGQDALSTADGDGQALPVVGCPSSALPLQDPAVSLHLGLDALPSLLGAIAASRSGPLPSVHSGGEI
jgi:hypothetical protein